MNLKSFFLLSLLSCSATTYAKQPMPLPPVSAYTKTDSVQIDKQAIADLLKTKTPITWLFTGNSITQGAKHTHGYRTYSEIFFERVRYEMGRPRDIIINTAVSGNATVDILKDFDWRVSHLKPQVVFLMIGTNDAADKRNISVEQYGKNLEKFVDQIRTLGAIPVFLSPTPILEEEALERKNLKQYVVKMEEITKKRSVIFVNQWHYWNTELKAKYKDQWSKQLLNDPLHPNGLGHKEMAINLFKELGIFDPKQPSGGGPYYEGVH